MKDRAPAAGQDGTRLARALACCAIIGLHSLAACALNGDFDRVRPSLVSDDMHAWIGSEVARANGVAASAYPLTDEERQLRDLAYPLIEPPYDRNQWYSALNEYGASRILQRDWYYYDPTLYHQQLATRPYRSATARFVQLNDDIRNEVARSEPFFILARRVIDIDRKREKSLAFVSGLTSLEAAHAQARVAENALIVSWVQHMLAQRAEAYRYALERLVIATPMPMAVEAERSLTLLRQKIADNQVVRNPPPALAAAAALARAQVPPSDHRLAAP